MTMYLLGAVVRVWRRIVKGGVSRLERGRLRSIAAASAPLHGEVLPAADRALVDAQHEIYCGWSTDEQPTVDPVRRRAVRRRAARWQQVARARRRLAPGSFDADPLRAANVAVPLERPVVLSGLVEPAPWLLESFTEEWTTAEFAALVAEAKAGASR